MQRASARERETEREEERERERGNKGKGSLACIPSGIKRDEFDVELGLTFRQFLWE